MSGPSDLRIIAGDGPVGQAFCDPTTFGGPSFDAGVRELLRLVWPSTPAQARLMWGARLAARARQHPVDELLPEAVADVLGVPSAVLRSVAAQGRELVEVGPEAPLRLLGTTIAEVVRDRDGARPDTVLDELLFWRGLAPERVSLTEVAELVTALTAALWDAGSLLLPGLLDAALFDPSADRSRLVDRVLANGPEVIGWLRTTTQAVLLEGELIPAGERCLLLVDASEPADRRTREPLRTMRWLSPDAPSGAGATFARLFGHALPMLPTDAIPLLEELPARHQPRRLQLVLHAMTRDAEPTTRPRVRRPRRG
ncbi:hypothetical protein ACQP00_01610 [Dactylosporangium sp. CS-047395]|uniref:hypothetical protein n=1 Tax=Dactylosporangium sp. CS-047395 TaxID=3239936 RepID=UPI003D8A2375